MLKRYFIDFLKKNLYLSKGQIKLRRILFNIGRKRLIDKRKFFSIISCFFFFPENINSFDERQ